MSIYKIFTFSNKKGIIYKLQNKNKLKERKDG